MKSFTMPGEMEINTYIFLVSLLAASLIVSLLVTKGLINRFTRQNIMAIPNNRSSHDRAVPVGGGWVIVGLTIIAWLIFKWPFSNAADIAVLVGIIVLAMLSWRDDKQPLPIVIRLIAQLAAIGSALYLLPENKLIFMQILPLWADRLLVAICWLWFINLFNFMDGIDGISGVEIIQISAGIGVVVVFGAINSINLEVLTIITGATAGFLWWNWHKAKIFLGDVGAITIGYVLGWLLIQLAAEGQLAAALILPLYYLVDATFTLLKRMFTGQKFWHAHKQHAYQRASHIAGSHSVIVIRLIVLNVFLLTMALWSISQPFAAIIVALIATIVTYFLLPLGHGKKGAE
ncbi:MAG: glycosyltransferase family 4 protein [Rhizobiaceae bacterium]|nr:glycosyltransferase family 4 protein [Rhizobiaceae bacterium]